MWEPGLTYSQNTSGMKTHSWHFTNGAELRFPLTGLSSPKTSSDERQKGRKRVRVRRNEWYWWGARRSSNSLLSSPLFLTQTVSSYVLLPSLLIFIPKMLRQEYKAGSAGSDDFGQISLLLLLTGSKYPSSHSGPGLSGLLHCLPLCPSSLLDTPDSLSLSPLSAKGLKLKREI